MFDLHSFLSWPVLLQALLAGGAAIMCWRGAHISGDRSRRHAIAWGSGSFATFFLTLLLGASSNHDSSVAVKEANLKAQASDTKLSAIQGSVTGLRAQNNELLGAINKIASGIKVDPDQSAQALARKIVERFSNLQKQIDEQKGQIEQAEKKDPNYLYQDNRSVAEVMAVTANGKSVIFNTLYNASDLNFDQQVYYRGLTLACGKQPIKSEILFIRGQGVVTNEMSDVDCIYVSGSLNDTTGLQVGRSLDPASPQLPAGK